MRIIASILAIAAGVGTLAYIVEAWFGIGENPYLHYQAGMLALVSGLMLTLSYFKLKSKHITAIGTTAVFVGSVAFLADEYYGYGIYRGILFQVGLNAAILGALLSYCYSKLISMNFFKSVLIASLANLTLHLAFMPLPNHLVADINYHPEYLQFLFVCYLSIGLLTGITHRFTYQTLNLIGDNMQPSR